MYLYCYGRSDSARETGNTLLEKAEGEWITDTESFAAGIREMSLRADSAIVLFLPPEAAVKLFVERFYPADIKFPVLRVCPDGSYAEILKAGGYNSYEIMVRICSVLGCRPLSGPNDAEDYAADLKKTIAAYNMTADNDELTEEVCRYIRDGGCVTVYSDIPLHMSEPVLDSMSFIPFAFRLAQKDELARAYQTCCETDEYSVFVTCSLLPAIENRGKCLKLIPKKVVLGLELTGRAAPEYAVETVEKSLVSHGIDKQSVVTVAVSDMTRESDSIMEISKALGCTVTSYDSRLLKAVKVPFDPSFNLSKTSDTCTAAACLASENGRIVIRRSGDRNSVMLSACIRRGGIMLTE